MAKRFANVDPAHSASRERGKRERPGPRPVRTARDVNLSGAMPQRSSRSLRFAVLLATVLLAAPRATVASPWGAGAGTEWSAVEHGASTSVEYGYGSFTLARTSVALGGLHYDDGSITANGPLFAGVAPLGPAVLLRAWAMRYFGDQDFRAWRLRGGPEWTLPGATTLGLYFSYLDSDRNGVLRSASAELAVPFRSHWTARMNGGASQLPGSDTATQGAIGLGWSPHSTIEITAEAGLARNGAFLGAASAGGGGSGGGGLPLPLGLGGGGGQGRGRSIETTTLPGTEPTLSLGLRVALP